MNPAVSSDGLDADQSPRLEHSDNMSRIIVLLLFASGLLLGITYTLLQRNIPVLPVVTEVLSPDIVESNFRLGNLTLGGTGRVYGSRGDVLHRVTADGQRTEVVNSLPARISAIHERADGLLVVATDDDHWDPRKPCTIYRSMDGGQSFEQVKQIEGGAVLWWSLDSDSEGRLFMGEYGPQGQGMSKTLWRSLDDGASWQEVYRAPDQDKVHLHRVAVDPWTDEIWLTVGDGGNRNMLRSSDHGETWIQVERLQATAVAFAEDAIFWGRDKKGKPGVLRYDRQSGRFSTWFNPRSRGNYAGSIYDMAYLPGGYLIVPFMKYPDQPHVASVWRGDANGEWTLILQLASEQGEGAGLTTVAGPDRDGWVYMSGYQFRVVRP